MRRQGFVAWAWFAVACSGVAPDGLVRPDPSLPAPAEGEANGNGPDGVADGTSGGGSAGGTSAGGGTSGGGSAGGTSAGGTSGGGSGTGGGGGSGTAGTGGTSGGSSGGSAPDGGAPVRPELPRAVGPCPAFEDGVATFRPAGGARTVRLYVSAEARGKRGPLVFYWYGTGGQPSQAQLALGPSLEAIEEAGGVVAAPVHDNEGQFPWLAGGDADYRLADEVAACAVERGGVDPTRIHSLGFSAGALFTARLAFARARYIASVVTYSGGLLENAPPPASQNPRNKFAALALSGGPRDNVFNTDFDVASRALQAKLTGDGHFALYCDHGGGHRIPTDYRRAAGKFLLDHPFGTTPSPYEGALPSELKACSAAP